jgi:hypothetical protein
MHLVAVRETYSMHVVRIIWTQIILRQSIFATNSAPDYNFRSLDFGTLITKLPAQYFSFQPFLTGHDDCCPASPILHVLSVLYYSSVGFKMFQVDKVFWVTPFHVTLQQGRH